MDETNKKFWEEEYDENPAHTWVPDRILEREIEGLRPGIALDLGCGVGKNALMLASHGWSVVGVDLAENAVAMAKTAAADAGLDATFLAADVTEWKTPRKFDLVISTYALPGKDKNEAALRTAAGALADGGTLIVAEWDKSMKEVWGWEEDDLLSPSEIAALLPGVEIDRAEVRRFEIFAPDDPRAREGTEANVAFVRGRRRRGND